MREIKGIELEKIKQTISRTDKRGNEKVLLILDFIYLREQQTIDKLTKELNQCHQDKSFYSEQWEKTSKRWENELDLQLKYSEYERKKNAKLTKEVEGLEKLASNRLIELSKNSNAWSKENTKLKEGLNDIKSQLFDVNNCDTILTSAIEQIIKRTKK